MNFYDLRKLKNSDSFPGWLAGWLAVTSDPCTRTVCRSSWTTDRQRGEELDLRRRRRKEILLCSTKNVALGSKIFLTKSVQILRQSKKTNYVKKGSKFILHYQAWKKECTVTIYR